MPFLEKTLGLIQQTAVKAAAVAITPIPGDDRQVVIQHGDNVQIYDLPPPRRRHEVGSLADLIDYTGRVAEGGGSPVVWHGPPGVIVVLDDGDRRDFVRFPLSHSERFATLKKLRAEKPWMKQQQFVRLLRIELGLPEPLVALFRKIDFASGFIGQTEVRHGADRLGKTIQATCNGVDGLPETIDVDAPVYVQPGERQDRRVRCNLEIDAANGMFLLAPAPDEIEAAVDMAQADIASRLIDGLTVPVFYGTP